MDTADRKGEADGNKLSRENMTPWSFAELSRTQRKLFAPFVLLASFALCKNAIDKPSVESIVPASVYSLAGLGVIASTKIRREEVMKILTQLRDEEPEYLDALINTAVSVGGETKSGAVFASEQLGVQLRDETKRVVTAS